MPLPPDRPSRVRYSVIAVTTLMSVLLYLDRFCTSFAATYIREDLGLSNVQIGMMMSAFFFTYALGQVPSGWLSDRFGVRRMLTIYILLWSFLTAATGWVNGLFMLLAVRLLFGVAQAGAYPTSAALLSKWAPFSARGAASSVIAFGGRIGGAAAPLLTAYCIVGFTSSSQDAALAPRDLLDPPRFAAEVLDRPATDPPPVRALREGLEKRLASVADDLRVLRAKHSAGNAEASKEAAKPSGGSTDPQPDSPLDPARLERVTEALNKNVLSDPSFFDAAQFDILALPNEARRIAQNPPTNLTPPQQRRFNRLLLESRFPDSIRKLYGRGWRAVMLTYGLSGLVVALLFYLVLRDRPDQHPRVNEGELALIEEGRPKGAPSPHGRVGGVPLMRLLTSRSMWLICLSQWCTNVGWVFLVTWLPPYLESVHQVPVEQRGWMTFFPSFIGWFGMLAGGLVTDRLVRVVGLRWGRALPLALTRFTAMAAYLYCVFFQPSAWGAVIAFAVVAFSTDMGTASTWAFKQDVGGKYVGSILGWGNMWGNLGAAVTPTLLILIVGKENNWTLAFLTCAGAFFIAGLAGLGVDATKPIAPPEKEEAE